jgi:hypothetical protein
MKFSSSVICGLVFAASTADAFMPSGRARFTPQTSSSSFSQIASTVTEEPKEAQPETINGAAPAVDDASVEAPKTVVAVEEKEVDPEPLKEEAPAAPVAAPAPVAAVAASAEPVNTDRIEPYVTSTRHRIHTHPYLPLVAARRVGICF